MYVTVTYCGKKKETKNVHDRNGYSTVKCAALAVCLLTVHNLAYCCMAHYADLKPC